MKCTTICMLAFCLQVSAGVFSQSITFSGKNVPLQKVFTAIEKQTNYVFFYNDEILRDAHPVTLNVKNASINTVMTECLKGQPLEFSIEDKTVFVTKKVVAKAVVYVEEAKPPVDVTGRVTDDQGNPLVGASVKVKGSNVGTTTNEKGEFVLHGVEESAMLEITYVGFDSQVIEVKNRKRIDISLGGSMKELDVALIKGYYTTTKRLSTGNVGKVTGETINKQPISNPLIGLAARVPGLFVTQSSGLPGAQVNIQIRGQNSIANGNQPLYLVDGVPFTVNTLTQIFGPFGSTSNQSPFNSINPADIESIEILKDADATAIYGSRGANGVIIITTKKGHAGKTKFDITAYTGIAKVTRMQSLLNTRQYLDMRYEALKNDAITLSPTTPGANDLTKWDTTRYTDWQDQLIGETAHIYDIQTSISGGNENTQFRLGLGFHREETVFPGDKADERISGQLNVSHTSVNKKFKGSITSNYSIDKNNLYSSDLTGSIFTPPNAPTYDENGSVVFTENGYTTNNPLAALLQNFSGITDYLINNATLNYQLFPGLVIKLNAGHTYTELNEKRIWPLKSFAPSPLRISGQSVFAMQRFKSWLLEPQLEYSVNINKSSIEALIGSSWQEETTNGTNINASNYSNEALLNSTAGAGTITTALNYLQYRYHSIFGRLNYKFSNKYLLNLTGRRDGSSRFGPGRQFAYFGAVGIGWIFSEENFIAKKPTFLSFGKLRASYGSSGNDKIGDYQFLDLYTSTLYSYQNNSGLIPSSLFNPDYAWEINKKLENAIDIGLINDRILLSVSWFRNRSSNQLLSSTLPVQTGFPSITRNLPALVRNTGWEFELKTTNIKSKSLSWRTSANLTILRNKLVDYPDLSKTSDAIKYEIGKPINIVKVYQFAGISESTGIYTFESETSTLTTADRTVIIDLNPKFFGGLNNSIAYKEFSLDFLFQFVKQIGRNFIQSFPTPAGLASNQPTEVLNRWQKTGDIAETQRYTIGVGPGAQAVTAFRNLQMSDKAYSDASFIRLKNVSLSYNLVNKWSRFLKITNLRFFLLGQNLLLFTNYKGNDPEVQNVSILPPLKYFTGGIQLTL